MLVFAPVPGSIAAFGLASYSKLPFVSLALGGMGAMAIICSSVLLSRFSWTGLLEYLGRNSIVVYLAFFLPMAVTRTLLLKFAGFLDIGTVSLLTMIAAASGPVILYLAIGWTGQGRFLFHRPAWAWIDKPKAAGAAKIRLHPAE